MYTPLADNDECMFPYFIVRRSAARGLINILSRNLLFVSLINHKFW